MKKSLGLFAVTAALAGASPTPAAASLDDGVRKLTFDVFLDDRPIGYQRYALMPAEDGVRIEVQARFEVKFLRLTAFAYDHHNIELWQGGCLQAIDSQTDSNGERFKVSGRAHGASFVVATNEAERSLGECVASFAYWDRDVLLQRRRLLNAQTGAYLDVRIESLGRDRLLLGDREIDVDRYAIRGQGVEITLAYALGSGDWVALEGKLEGGRTLRYRRAAVELSPAAAHGGVGADGLEAGR